MRAADLDSVFWVCAYLSCLSCGWHLTVHIANIALGPERNPVGHCSQGMVSSMEGEDLVHQLKAF